jgi:hypothetical protein
MSEKINDMEEIPLTGTKVPVNFVFESEEGEDEEFTIEMDSQVFYILCQEAMRKGIRVEDFILESLLEYMEEPNGDRS